MYNLESLWRFVRRCGLCGGGDHGDNALVAGTQERIRICGAVQSRAKIVSSYKTTRAKQILKSPANLSLNVTTEVCDMQNGRSCTRIRTMQCSIFHLTFFSHLGQRGRYVSMSTDSWHACNCLNTMVCFLRHKLFVYVELRTKTSYAI